jgi:dTDP-4-amino-4,6-dideoxygalactose transaminase
MKLEVDFSARAITYTDEEVKKVLEVMTEAPTLTQGEYLTKFEAKAKEYFEVDNVFAVANGTNALELSAMLSNLKEGDEVIIPSHTFCASAIPFARTGAKIVWADIDPDTRLIDPEDIKRKITDKTKALVIVHLYGMSCNMDKIMDIVEKNNLVLIEDCAQSLGAEYKSKKTGTFGDFSIFSLHTQKNITTLGEGGLLIVKDDNVAKHIPGLRHNGLRGFAEKREHYWKPAMANVDLDVDNLLPHNFCITEVQCALGEMLFDRLDELNNKRIKRARKFQNELKEFKELSFQKVDKYDNKHVYHLLSAKYNGQEYNKTNDDLIELLFNKYKIKTVVQYCPLNRYPLFEKIGFGEADCPNSDDFFDNMISFPFQVWMSEKEFEYMIESVKNALIELRS